MKVAQIEYSPFEKHLEMRSPPNVRSAIQIFIWVGKHELVTQCNTREPCKNELRDVDFEIDLRLIGWS